MYTDFSGKCFFCQNCCFFKSTADANTYNYWWAGIWAGFFYCIYNCFFYAFYTISRFQHTDFTHIFTAKAFWCNSNLHLISRNDFIMNNCRCVVFCIHTKKRISHYGFSQISFLVSLTYTFIDCVFHTATFKMYILSYSQEYNCHTGILTNRNHIFSCNIQVFQKLSQNLFCKRFCLSFMSSSHSLVHIWCQEMICLNTHFFNIFCQKFYIYAANHVFFLQFSCSYFGCPLKCLLISIRLKSLISSDWCLPSIPINI